MDSHAVGQPNENFLNADIHIGLIAQGGAGWAGGAEYIRNLARAVRTANPKARLTLICGEHQAADWAPFEKLFDAIRPIATPKRRSLSDRFLGSNRRLRSALSACGCDFVYPFTYDNRYNVGAEFPLGHLGCAWGGWIPDFQHRHLPQLFSEKECRKRDAGIGALVREAPQVVLSSESAAADFRRFYPEHENKARVLTFGTFPNHEWYEDFREEDISWLPPRYFAVCNQFWSHKNHAIVFRALELLARRNVRPVVVCTGALLDYRQPDHTERLLQQIHRAGISSQVIVLGMVSRRLQMEILRRSLAVVQPSLFEGWSTVVEDARALGKTALLSDLDVHKEQNPPGSKFFPREDVDTLAELLHTAWLEFEAGPDKAAEERARLQAEARIAEIGKNLLVIAAEGLR